MTCKELQEEELEVLRSIYDGDECFKELSSTCFQYRIGESGNTKSFLLEVSWGERYPDAAPAMNLDAFYNKHILPEVKSVILNGLHTEAELQLGTAMTYTILEWAKDHAVELMEAQPEKVVSSEAPIEEPTFVANGQIAQAVKEEKKVKLSKQQKRRLFEKLDSKGQRPRGWDWVDIVKHLSQLGPKQTTNDPNS